ncbi:alkaline phosphatase family protein [Streptomyces sp. SP18CS02]|uniref:alkaline phosphatase family protein n=1 Tax=Streptomyces sp. SP18CS02 TaxID=3002531 RepID=UPI002E79EC73|nr:alkaline phosphatase family protein [Streptomyces sp. SP18CS02]MEE1755240.1 alkaline phosphatase family protein [Streptomyces sp. SP18CS02]
MHLTRSLRAALAAAVAATLPLVAAVQADAAGSSDTAGTHGAKRPKSLVIGIDGATFAAFDKAGMPNIKNLMATGMTATSNLYAAPMAPTSSGPGWSSIATGVWPDKHKVVDNAFTGADFARYPDYATRMEAAAPALNTLVVGTWSPVATTVFGPATDTRLTGADDADTTAKAVSRLASTDADATFVHLDEVDGAGHSYGAASPTYLNALTTADARVGKLLQAVTSRPAYGDEDWLIMLTADHGHTDGGGHGGNSQQERQTFVIANGAGFAPGSVRHDVKVTDVAPTVLDHAGITVDPAWRLDGEVIGAAAPDAFDTLRPSLRTRVDESGLPSTRKGWTNTPPSGWTIDNSAMPTGGVTEWRGWSFATDEFWTNAALGQGRETNVRARDVFALADSDEWDDKAHGAGQFDSTLISPAFAVTGGAPATVSYATHYKVDGPQTGDVLISYDGGAPQPLKSYRTDVNTVERIAFGVPAGVTSARLHFRYTGTNSAFWTVDRVSLTR